MKVLHLIGGGDVGGAKIHVLSLVKALNEFANIKIISYRPGSFSREALEMGINIEVVKTGTIFGDIKHTLNIIKKGKYEIVHSHGAKANMISAIISKLISIPTVTTIHSDYKLDYLDNIFKHISFGSINRMALRTINYHIGVSDSFKQMLIDRNFDANNIFTVYNGIDFNKQLHPVSKQDFLKKYNIALDNNIFVGILARLHPVKGIDTLLSAAAILCTKLNNIHFLIGGDGPERKHLEKMAESLNIKQNVHFLGYIDDPDSFMNAIDINVLTSISESFPYVILEGARLKKPTISTSVGGISDLIKHGTNGYLFDIGNEKQLADYIEQLIANTDLMTKMGNNIYESAKQNYSLEKMRDTQLNIYKTILNYSD